MSSDLELRRKLQRLGVNVGPITGSTRGLYRARLRDLSEGGSTSKASESGTGSTSEASESGTGSEESENEMSSVSLAAVFPRPHNGVWPPARWPPSDHNMPEKYDWELLPKEVTICTKNGSPWKLGAGSYGEVFKGMRDEVDEVAVKTIRSSSCDPVKFKAEIDLISKLRHRHIVQFYGACVQPPDLSIVMELMSSDLFSVLGHSKERKRYNWTGVYGKKVLIGVALGLNYLHSRNPPVVHRDIKSPNILVMDGLAKIADVGLARTMISIDIDMTPQSELTYDWAAPEVRNEERATAKVDIWSFGILVWEVVSGKQPICKNLKHGFPKQSRYLDLDLTLIRRLFGKCTNATPRARPKASEAIRELQMC